MLLLFLISCAHQTVSQSPPPPPPAWTTRSGQETTKFALAEALLESNNPEAALNLIGQMRQEDISTPDLDVLQARAFAAVGLVDDAEALLGDVLSRHSRRADAHNTLGILYLDTQRLQPAIGAFEEAARLDSNNPEYANNLGFSLLASGEAAAAVDALRIALKQDASQIRTRNNLGFALIANGQEDEAYRVFRSAVTEADARYNLGVGLERRGDPEKAIVQYSAAIDADASHEAAALALNRLQTVEDSP